MASGRWDAIPFVAYTYRWLREFIARYGTSHHSTSKHSTTDYVDRDITLRAILVLERHCGCGYSESQACIISLSLVFEDPPEEDQA
jgi:hypothetical protein